MESEARYTLVGTIVVALVVAAVGAVVWLTGAGAREQVDRYSIYFQRQSLDGLQVGAPVTMLGVGVGRVEGYTVDTRTMNRVRVTVRVDPRTPVTAATTAIVQRNLLTGIARIALSPPAEAGAIERLAAVPSGEEYPVIAEGVSDIEQIADAANRITRSGAVALDNLNEVLSIDNRAALAQTLANVRDVTTALNNRMERLDGTMASFTQAAADVGRAGREFAETARELRGAAGPVLTQVDATLREFSQAAGRFERDATAATRRIDLAVEVGTLELGATTREIRSTAEILARTVDRVRDPRTLLFGPSEGQLGPGERLR